MKIVKSLISCVVKNKEILSSEFSYSFGFFTVTTDLAVQGNFLLSGNLEKKVLT